MDTNENEQIQETVTETQPEQTVSEECVITDETVTTSENAPTEEAEIPENESSTSESESTETKKKKFSFKLLLRPLIAAALVIGLIFASCIATALFLNYNWNSKLALAYTAAMQRIDVLQDQIENPGIYSDHLIVGDLYPAPENALTPAQIYAANVTATVAIKTSGGTGSGFIIRNDGYIVTNYHVVEGQSLLNAVTHDGVSHPAKLIGYSRPNDVAVLKIEGTDFPCVTFGSSDAMQVGDQVVAIGNPLGELTATLTVGYVSAKDRVVDSSGSAMNLMQTDAAINSGNSGGPLFNIYGQVVGIAKSKYSGVSSSGASIEGIGFAIPINDVFGIIDDICKYGYITGGYLGVSVRDVEAAVVENYGLPAGAYVASTEPGLSADRAGLQARDIITNIGGYDVTSVASLTRVLRNFKAGETTTITIFRSGADVILSITIDPRPADSQ